MADKGSIGNSAVSPIGGNAGAPYGYGKRIVIIDAVTMLPRTGRNDTEGNPTAPSLCLGVQGSFRFRWAVASGTRTVSVSVKQAVNLSPRPRLRIKANAGIGVAADVTADAGSGTGWVTIGPATINPTSDGAVWVELENRLEGTCDAFFDNLAFT